MVFLFCFKFLWQCLAGLFCSGPKKNELKIGKSSAFFTYVKSSTVKNDSQGVNDNAAQNLRMGVKHQGFNQGMVQDPHIHGDEEAGESYSPGDDGPHSSGVLNSVSMERSCTPPISMGLTQQRDFKNEKFSPVLSHPRNEHQLDVSALFAQAAFPFCISGVVNQVMTSTAQLYPKNLHDLQSHASEAMMSQYHHLSQCHPHVNGMTSFPYYPVNMYLQAGQMSSSHSWPVEGSTSVEIKLNNVDRREAALMKFRQKRKERCFDKKIRYANRKQLANRRPRARGQFVRKVNGVNVDLNGQPSSANSDDDDGEDEEKDA